MVESVEISRYGLIDEPTDVCVDGDEMRLCEGCASEYGASDTRNGKIEDLYNPGDMLVLYWVETYGDDDVDEKQCEDCEAYHGECYWCEESMEYCECEEG